MNRPALLALTASITFITGCKQQPTVSPQSADTRATAQDAYIYGYPLLLMDVTCAKVTNVPQSTPLGAAPPNQFSNIKAFPDATFTDVVSPNADTLYSSAFL